METMIFLGQGPAVDPYRVTFKKDGNNLNAYCTWPASASGQYCKHHWAIPGGETVGILSRDGAQVQTVAPWLSGSDVAEAMELSAHRRRARV